MSESLPITSKFNLTNEQLLHIFREIRGGRGQHGSFLSAFATAMVSADYSNLYLMRSTAQGLVDKYQLEKYLDNWDGI